MVEHGGGMEREHKVLASNACTCGKEGGNDTVVAAGGADGTNDEAGMAARASRSVLDMGEVSRSIHGGASSNREAPRDSG